MGVVDGAWRLDRWEDLRRGWSRRFTASRTGGAGVCLTVHGRRPLIERVVTDRRPLAHVVEELAVSGRHRTPVHQATDSASPLVTIRFTRSAGGAVPAAAGQRSDPTANIRSGAVSRRDLLVTLSLAALDACSGSCWPSSSRSTPRSAARRSHRRGPSRLALAPAQPAFGSPRAAWAALEPSIRRECVRSGRSRAGLGGAPVGFEAAPRRHGGRTA